MCPVNSQIIIIIVIIIIIINIFWQRNADILFIAI